MQHTQDKKLVPITEIFVSISGEGSTSGEIITFVRTAGCNLRCSYCDTKYSFKEDNYMTIDEIIDVVKKNNTPKVVLTGGEPLFGESKRTLAIELAKHFDVYIETNGAVPLFKEQEVEKVRKNLHYVIDYKTISSGMNKKDLLTENINLLNETDEIKFVIGNLTDYEGVLEVIEKNKEEISKKKITLLFGCVFEEIQPDELVEMLKEKNDYFVNNNIKYKFYLQIHKFIWDPNERGV